MNHAKKTSQSTFLPWAQLNATCETCSEVCELTFENQTQIEFIINNQNTWWISELRKCTLSCPESLTRKFRGNVTSMTCEDDSLFASVDSFLFFRVFWFPYKALVTTSPSLSICLSLFLFATFCSNCWAFSAAALASLTYTKQEVKFFTSLNHDETAWYFNMIHQPYKKRSHNQHS